MFSHVSARTLLACQQACASAIQHYWQGPRPPLYMCAAEHADDAQPTACAYAACSCGTLLPQFKQTLEALVRCGGASPKMQALVQILQQHFQVRRLPCSLPLLLWMSFPRSEAALPPQPRPAPLVGQDRCCML